MKPSKHYEYVFCFEKTDHNSISSKLIISKLIFKMFCLGLIVPTREWPIEPDYIKYKSQPISDEKEPNKLAFAQSATLSSLAEFRPGF